MTGINQLCENSSTKSFFSSLLERIATAVEEIELRVSEGTLDQPLLEEVVGLRSDIAEVQSGLHAIAQIGPQELTAQMIRILGGWLNSYSSDR